MAKVKDLPAFREKRRILFGHNTTPQKMQETARLFMEAERYDEALEFLSRTDAARTSAADDVRQIVRVALERGDTPLLLRAKRVLREKASEEEFLQCGEAALRAGRKAMAYLACVKAGRTEEAEKLRAEVFGVMPEEQDPAAPDRPDVVPAKLDGGPERGKA